MIVKVENPHELREKLKERALVLYGMGVLGMKIARWLDSEGISYVFADKKAQEKQKLTQKKVVNPDELRENYPDANIIISTNIYFDEVKEYLLEIGFPEEQILSYTLFIPSDIVWGDLEDNIDWERMRFAVEKLARWIDEETESVADYGAGQMYLKSFLKTQIKYYPIDYMKRFEETIVCDLNAGVFPEIRADAAVLSGVLEYLTTAQDLLVHVCERTRRQMIISYVTMDSFPDIRGRRASGYVSDLEEKQIVQILAEKGFHLMKKELPPLSAAGMSFLFER